MRSRSGSTSELKLLVTQSPAKHRNAGGSNVVMLLSVFVILIGPLANGTMLGLSSPMIPEIQNDVNPELHLSVSEASWFGSLITLGGVVGGISAGFIMQWIGRKWTSIISGLPFIIGLLFIALADQKWMLYVGRIVTGLGLGISSCVAPTYIGEVSTAQLRGALGSANQLCIVSGILLIYGIGSVLPWRWLAAVAIIPPTLLSFFSCFIPETPRYLMMKQKTEAARKSLQLIRGKTGYIKEEYEELEENLNTDQSSASWFEIIKDPGLRTPLLLSLACMYFQQLSGINCIMFYAKSIFEEAGFTGGELTLALILVATTQVFFTFISCIIIDKTGRKLLIVVGAVIMTLSLLVFGLYFQIQQLKGHTMFGGVVNHQLNTNVTLPGDVSDADLTWMALISMMVFIAAYSIGIGPIAWLMVGEIIPVRARSRGAGLATGFNLFLAFILTLQFSNMLAVITPQGTFWIFGINCALSILFTMCFMPETKAVTLEEIEKFFRGEGTGLI